MSDLPSKEELARALAEKLASIDWFVVDDTERWQAVAGDLLDAILPPVMRGPVEALGPFARHYEKMKATERGEATDEVIDVGETEYRRARSVRQWAEKIGGG